MFIAVALWIMSRKFSYYLIINNICVHMYVTSQLLYKLCCMKDTCIWFINSIQWLIVGDLLFNVIYLNLSH